MIFRNTNINYMLKIFDSILDTSKITPKMTPKMTQLGSPVSQNVLIKFGQTFSICLAFLIVKK